MAYYYCKPTVAALRCRPPGRCAFTRWNAAVPANAAHWPFQSDPRQKMAMLVASIGFIALLVVPAFDYRFNGRACRSPWSSPAIYSRRFASTFGIVSIGKTLLLPQPLRSQEIRKSSLLGPMQLFVIRCMQAGCCCSLVHRLRSVHIGGLVILPLILPALLWRLFDEEHFLAKNLPGYAEYCSRIRCVAVERETA